MHYVYILQSCIDQSLYIGSTADLKKRIEEHNSGKSRFTNQHRPYKLICYLALLLKSDAKRVEEYLKSGYGRRVLNNLNRDYLRNS